MAYIGSGSIEFQGTRIEIKKRLLISGSIAANAKTGNLIALSGGDGGGGFSGITSTVLGSDHPWESYMELDCGRITQAGGMMSNLNFIRIGPGDYPGQIVNMAITVPASASSNQIALILSGSPGNAAAGYAGLFADGVAPTINGSAGGSLGHLGAAWQMIWNGTYWILTQKNNHISTTDLG